MLQGKTLVFSTVKQFYHMIDTQFKTKILMISSDNGSKFKLLALTFLLQMAFYIKTQLLKLH